MNYTLRIPLIGVLCLLMSLDLSAQHTPLTEALKMLTPAFGYAEAEKRALTGELAFPISSWEKKPISGDYLYMQYRHESTDTAPFENDVILKHYFKIAKEQGGAGIFRGKVYGAYKMAHKGHDLRFLVEIYDGGLSYSLIIVKVGDAKAETPEIASDSSKDLYQQIISSGRVSLYFNFETGSSTLSDDSGSALKEVLTLMEEHPSLQLKIEGHTDNVGEEARNQILSEARANAIHGYLISKGVDRTRITAQGFGSSQPIASNDTEEGRSRNRRVDLVKVSD